MVLHQHLQQLSRHMWVSSPAITNTSFPEGSGTATTAGPMGVAGVHAQAAMTIPEANQNMHSSPMMLLLLLLLSDLVLQLWFGGA
jgi:hypothetical protein